MILLLGVDVVWLINEGAPWYPVMFGAGVTMIGVGITLGEPRLEDRGLDSAGPAAAGQ